MADITKDEAEAVADWLEEYADAGLDEIYAELAGGAAFIHQAAGLLRTLAASLT